MRTAIIEAAELVTHQRRPPGELLFMEGNEPTGIYILHSGIVELFFAARDRNAKRLRIAEPGHILGLSAVVTHRSQDCSAITLTECEVGFIDRDEFLQALEEKPDVWFSILAILSRDVNAVYDDMRALSAR